MVTGPLGLVTLKNLLEKGFKATGFDKADVVGGLWNYRDDDQTTVLKSASRGDNIFSLFFSFPPIP